MAEGDTVVLIYILGQVNIKITIRLNLPEISNENKEAILLSFKDNKEVEDKPLAYMLGLYRQFCVNLPAR